MSTLVVLFCRKQNAIGARRRVRNRNSLMVNSRQENGTSPILVWSNGKKETQMTPTDEQKLTAINAMIAAYVEKYAEQPDDITRMVINANAERVASGKKFCWMNSGNWRKLCLGTDN